MVDSSSEVKRTSTPTSRRRWPPHPQSAGFFFFRTSRTMAAPSRSPDSSPATSRTGVFRLRSTTRSLRPVFRSPLRSAVEVTRCLSGLFDFVFAEERFLIRVDCFVFIESDRVFAVETGRTVSGVALPCRSTGSLLSCALHTFE